MLDTIDSRTDTSISGIYDKDFFMIILVKNMILWTCVKRLLYMVASVIKFILRIQNKLLFIPIFLVCTCGCL